MKREMTIGARSAVALWLFSGCFLIFTMVIVGGVTRLTGSGLSITKWNVVTGTIPPLNEADWQTEFDHYRETPQFKKINSHFDVHDFKQIYWWEYIHRLLGRLIGIVFIIPFLWFLYKKYLSSSLIKKCLLLFFLGGFQGFVGWYMVMSGLVDNPSVSHYRLAMHLLTAFITFGFTFWFAFELINTEKITLVGWKKKFRKLVSLTFLLVIIQIIFGAFVAGLKAGYIYNTWPLMGDKLIADSVFASYAQEGILSLVNSLSGVQVMHRYIAYLVVAAVAGLAWYASANHKKSPLTNSQCNAMNFVVVVVITQFLLGVITLLMHVPVWLGVVHQVGAFCLFSAMIYQLHTLTYTSIREAADAVTER